MTTDYRHPDEALLRSIDIHDLLPHQEPFVMVGSMVQFDGVRMVCEMNIKADNLFVEDNCFSASGMIENIAQTCAVRLGYVNKYIFGKDVQIGFIGALRNMEVFGLAEVGQTITTLVDVREEVFGMTLASAVVRQGDRILMTTEMKIAVKEQ